MDQTINLYFGGDLTNLYDLGWISTDLNFVLEFSELIERGEMDRVEKYFGEKARPFNRYASLIEKRERKPEIVDVKKGSIELVLAGLGVAAAVIMPLVAIAVQRHLAETDETISFQVSPQDPELKRIMDAYESGVYGRGTFGLQNLFPLLQRMNYDVTILSQNIYIVEHVVERYSQRIVRTIKKNR